MRRLPLISSLSVSLLASLTVATAARAAPNQRPRPTNPPMAASPPGGLNLPPLPVIPPLPPISGETAPAPDPEPATSPLPEVEPPPQDETSLRLRELEQQIQQTRELTMSRRSSVTIGGYVDFGFFVPQGDGSGIVRDNGNRMFPQYGQGQYGWVFLGDLLAPTINSRGEVADLGDAAGVERFDSVHSRGAPGFIANEVNLTLATGLGESVLGTVSVNFVPRTGSDFALGDFFDLDIAQLEWVLTRSGNVSLFVGKMDSVLGIEYRDRKSNQRFGVTPSLLARYTTGTALGLKMRAKLLPNEMLVLAAAVTNGSNSTEQFHFFNEVDTNAGKTASGRLSLRLPLPFDLEIGASGSYGAQDRARNNDGMMKLYGVDLLAHAGPVDLKAQWLKGKSPGNTADDVYGLTLNGGAYGEADVMITPSIGLLARGEFRDAFVWLGDAKAPEGANRAYVTKVWRATGGLRFVFTERIVLKAEYLHNGEYGGLPQIKDDVFTSSLVFMN
jgi:hypothetical protein